jgi:transposase-like protein
MSGVGALEIIRGIERRRRWSLADKQRIVEEVETPGAVFAAVARRHDISRGQLWNWRRQFRSSEIGDAVPSMPKFLPLCIAPEQVFSSSTDAPTAAHPPPQRAGSLGIWPDGDHAHQRRIASAWAANQAGYSWNLASHRPGAVGLER